MKAFKFAFSLALFVLYYYLFAKRYVEKYTQGGVIKTNHEEKPQNITPPGLKIGSLHVCFEDIYIYNNFRFGLYDRGSNKRNRMENDSS